MFAVDGASRGEGVGGGHRERGAGRGDRADSSGNCGLNRLRELFKSFPEEYQIECVHQNPGNAVDEYE